MPAPEGIPDDETQPTPGSDAAAEDEEPESSVDEDADEPEAGEREPEDTDLGEEPKAAAELEREEFEPGEEPKAAVEPEDDQPQAEGEVGDAEPSGIAALGEIILNPSVHVALFAGAEGAEGAGGVAFTAARQGAKAKLRCLVIDLGPTPSEALGNQRPGLCDLLGGEASFGEAIRRDDTTGVHVVSFGSNGKAPPLQRMRLVLGALTHTYDKVIVVSDKVDDWPSEHVRPDVAAIVCGPETSEAFRTEVYDVSLARGAKSAIIVRYTSDLDFGGGSESSAAA